MFIESPFVWREAVVLENAIKDQNDVVMIQSHFSKDFFFARISTLLKPLSQRVGMRT